jgi:hypothetical protein
VQASNSISIWNNPPSNFSGGGGYLVDDYSPAAAYSLRLLSSTYAGSAVRVRRSSDNSEQDIGFSGDDFDEASLATFCAATDGYVTKWYDQSGNSKDLAQTTAGTQPRISLTGITQPFASRYGISWGVTGNRRLFLGSALSALNSEPNSIFLTMITTSATYQSLVNTNSTGASSSSRLQLYTGTYPSITKLFSQYKNTGGTSYKIEGTGGMSTSTDYVLSNITDSSKNFHYFANGSEKASGNTFTGTYVNNVLDVGYNAALGQKLIGVMGELIIFGSDETSNRTDIEDNINDYFSIY